MSEWPWDQHLADGRFAFLISLLKDGRYGGVRSQKAKKAHWCTECGRRVYPGERYLRLAIFRGNHIASGIEYSGKLCGHCEIKLYNLALRREA